MAYVYLSSSVRKKEEKVVVMHRLHMHKQIADSQIDTFCTSFSLSLPYRTDELRLACRFPSGEKEEQEQEQEGRAGIPYDVIQYRFISSLTCSITDVMRYLMLNS